MNNYFSNIGTPPHKKLSGTLEETPPRRIHVAEQETSEIARASQALNTTGKYIAARGRNIEERTVESLTNGLEDYEQANFLEISKRANDWVELRTFIQDAFISKLKQGSAETGKSKDLATALQKILQMQLQIANTPGTRNNILRAIMFVAEHKENFQSDKKDSVKWPAFFDTLNTFLSASPEDPEGYSQALKKFPLYMNRGGGMQTPAFLIALWDRLNAMGEALSAGLEFRTEGNRQEAPVDEITRALSGEEQGEHHAQHVEQLSSNPAIQGIIHQLPGLDEKDLAMMVEIAKGDEEQVEYLAKFLAGLGKAGLEIFKKLTLECQRRLFETYRAQPSVVAAIFEQQAQRAKISAMIEKVRTQLGEHAATYCIAIPQDITEGTLVTREELEEALASSFAEFEALAQQVISGKRLSSLEEKIQSISSNQRQITTDHARVLTTYIAKLIKEEPSDITLEQGRIVLQYLFRAALPTSVYVERQNNMEIRVLTLDIVRQFLVARRADLLEKLLKHPALLNLYAEALNTSQKGRIDLIHRGTFELIKLLAQNGAFKEINAQAALELLGVQNPAGLRALTEILKNVGPGFFKAVTRYLESNPSLLSFRELLRAGRQNGNLAQMLDAVLKGILNWDDNRKERAYAYALLFLGELKGLGMNEKAFAQIAKNLKSKNTKTHAKATEQAKDPKFIAEGVRRYLVKLQEQIKAPAQLLVEALKAMLEQGASSKMDSHELAKFAAQVNSRMKYLLEYLKGVLSADEYAGIVEFVGQMQLNIEDETVRKAIEKQMDFIGKPQQ